MKKIETLQEYQLLAARTLPDLGSLQKNILHMEAGATGEFLGEVVDILKKKVAYNKEIDKVHLAEELADTMWYIAGAETIGSVDGSGLGDPQVLKAIEAQRESATLKIKQTIVEGETDLETATLAFILANKQVTDAKRGNFLALAGICVAICELLEIDFWQALTNNIAKLQVRYPEKFTTEAALNRNLDAERKELEK
jgi:hypothetical protein